jgi:hypothetical protein
MVSSSAKGFNAEEGIAAVDGGGALEKCERQIVVRKKGK